MRAVSVLRTVDFVAAEDTRRTRQLLTHLGIAKPLVSLHVHNEDERSHQLIARLQAGESAALVTDAGMPGISDPGALFVQRARQAGINVVAVPGPAAVTTALAGSGAPADRFVFEGFLPRRGTARQERLQALAAEPRTVVLYEAPHRLLATLADLAAVAPQRTVTVARELTKLHEEYRTGTAAELAEAYRDGVRGEITLVIHAGSVNEAAAPGPERAEAQPGPSQWREVAAALVAAGATKKDAARYIAKQYGIARRTVYQALLEHQAGATRD